MRLKTFLFIFSSVALVVFFIPAMSAHGQSTGLVIESVDDYSLRNGPSLSNSVANGDGFLRNMLYPGSPWRLKTRWINGLVWDTDFMDPALDRRGNDSNNFDPPGAAISYFTGHGFCNDGCSATRCNTTAVCTNPNAAAGQRLPGTCRFSPMDAPRCCYMTDRAAATSGSFDQFGGVVNYTSGPIRWGESPSSHGWGGAGTDGGTNLVVLDISCGILPPFWYLTMANADAGVHMIATIMVAGGDTANVADRGGTFAMAAQANPAASVSLSWLNTMIWLPANEGSGCPGGGGGHGFNGCGCNIVVAMDSLPEWARAHHDESWVALQNDNVDTKSNSFYSARWQCNYPLSSTDQRAWEIP